MANEGGRYEVKGGKKELTERTDWIPDVSAKKSNKPKLKDEVISDAVPKKVHPSQN